jgi:hypothetical protein
MKLIPMTEYVLDKLNNTAPINFAKGLESIRKYAEFLQKPLTIEMFLGKDGQYPIFKNVIHVRLGSELHIKVGEITIFRVNGLDTIEEEDAVIYWEYQTIEQLIPELDFDTEVEIVF